jgi:hypothetical protein
MSLKQTANRNRGECCRTIKPFVKKPTQTLVVVIATTWLAVPPATGAQSDEGKRAGAALEDQARHCRAVAQPPADLRSDSERIFRPARGEVIEILKATNVGLDYT